MITAPNSPNPRLHIINAPLTMSFLALGMEMKIIIKEEAYTDIKNFKEKFPLSRKYLITYLGYLDKFSEIKNEGGKRSISQ